MAEAADKGEGMMIRMPIPRRPRKANEGPQSGPSTPEQVGAVVVPKGDLCSGSTTTQGVATLAEPAPAPVVLPPPPALPSPAAFQVPGANTEMDGKVSSGASKGPGTLAPMVAQPQWSVPPAVPLACGARSAPFPFPPPPLPIPPA